MTCNRVYVCIVCHGFILTFLQIYSHYDYNYNRLLEYKLQPRVCVFYQDFNLKLQLLQF